MEVAPMGRSLASVAGAVMVSALLLACARARAQDSEPIPLEEDEPFVHGPSGFSFPAHLGTFTRASADKYDETGRNVSVGYLDRGQKVLVSVYVYPHGGQSLKTHFERVKGEVAQVHPRAKLTADEAWTLKQGSNDEGAEGEEGKKAGRTYAGRKATYEFALRRRGGEAGGDTVVSEAYLLRHGEFFIKFRVTCPADNHPAASDRVERFLRRLTLPEAPRAKAVTQT
jgi:hypothetical protein